MESPFTEMKRRMGFGASDSANLAEFHPIARPHLRGIVDHFYDNIMGNEETRGILSGPAQIERLRATLLEWADRLLAGPHDDAYFELRSRIGRTHVRVGLRQIYMFTSMNVLRSAFAGVVDNHVGQAEARRRILGSVHKVLDLELAMMLETYREDYVGQLHRSEQQAALKRLADIGQMAATVAHEVRNPLAGISGAIEVLRDDLPADSPRREVIREILEQVRRLDDHVRDLLVYARNVDLTIEEVPVPSLVRGTLALLQEEPMMQGVTSRVVVGDDAASHPMDRHRMQEVLVNLIRNAARAMQGTGRIVVSAKRQNGGGLVLIVEDSGPGIPEDQVADAFKPFYTTWPQGTGLGLSICRKTLEAHGGSLDYRRGDGGGACFVAVLPPPGEAP